MALTTDHLLQQVARLEALNANLTFRISRMAKLLEAEGAQRLEGSGLNLTSYRMMMVIAIFEEISVSDLSKLMLIDRAQISRAASDLIEDGLLEAKADRTSKRKKLLALTEAGRAKLGPLKQRFNARQIDIEAALDAKGMAGLWHAIDRIDALVQESLDRNG